MTKKCSTYKQRIACQGRATYVVLVPNLNGELEGHLLCDACANERLTIRDYPWIIKKRGKE